MKASCGFKVPDYSKTEPLAAPVGSESLPKKTVYPSITLRGKAAEALMGAETGKSFDAVCRIRVVAKVEREGGRSEWGGMDESHVEVEVESIECECPQEQGAPEQDAAGAIKSYFSK